MFAFPQKQVMHKVFVRLSVCLWLFVFAILCLCNDHKEAAAQQAVDSAGKVLVVLVFDQNCKAWCSNVRPVMKDLQSAYGEQVAFAELDATDNLVRQTEQKAKELGIRGFFDDARGYVPVVQIFTRT